MRRPRAIPTTPSSPKRLWGTISDSSVTLLDSALPKAAMPSSPMWFRDNFSLRKLPFVVSASARAFAPLSETSFESRWSLCKVGVSLSHLARATAPSSAILLIESLMSTRTVFAASAVASTSAPRQPSSLWARSTSISPTWEAMAGPSSAAPVGPIASPTKSRSSLRRVHVTSTTAARSATCSACSPSSFQVSNKKHSSPPTSRGAMTARCCSISAVQHMLDPFEPYLAQSAVRASGVSARSSL
mmetsp:Transcript_33065/g.86477  ORF Transcript_33065/g.86477 Transcript_33065/m.86477 type:complete len:244 (+) Transcript_33065:1095-1826(+)